MPSVRYGVTVCKNFQARRLDVEFELIKDWTYEGVYAAARAWVREKAKLSVDARDQALLLKYLKDIGDL